MTDEKFLEWLRGFVPNEYLSCNHDMYYEYQEDTFKCKKCGILQNHSFMLRDYKVAWDVCKEAYGISEAQKNIIEWAKYSIPEMDCRNDEDCDHCYGMQLLHDLRMEVEGR